MGRGQFNHLVPLGTAYSAGRFTFRKYTQSLFQDVMYTSRQGWYREQLFSIDLINADMLNLRSREDIDEEIADLGADADIPRLMLLADHSLVARCFFHGTERIRTGPIEFARLIQPVSLIEDQLDNLGFLAVAEGAFAEYPIVAQKAVTSFMELCFDNKIGLLHNGLIMHTSIESNGLLIPAVEHVSGYATITA